MKVIGIIAEYNPFHYGHQYQIQQARKTTGADYVMIAMSGDFVQRGEPAIYDKYTRTHMALSSGADLVLELPSIFATSSAEDFAACGVALLDKLGVADTLCFGSECGDVGALGQIASILLEPSPVYVKALKEQIKSGNSYPGARQEALMTWLTSSKEDYAPTHKSLFPKLLSSPNNILGIEYLKALQSRNSKMQPITIKRQGQGYHEATLDGNGTFASASAIRRALAHQETDVLSGQLPIVPPAAATCIFANDLSGLWNHRLLSLLYQGIDLCQFADVSSELRGRIARQELKFSSFTEHIEACKTKQYTYTRVSRALLHILLDMKKEQADTYRQMDYVSYGRILGFRKGAEPLLTALKNKTNISLITKTADAFAHLDTIAYEQFSQDLYCSHVYQALMYEKSGVRLPNEYTRSLVIV